MLLGIVFCIIISIPHSGSRSGILILASGFVLLAFVKILNLLRSKTKVLHDFTLRELDAKYFPMWNYDGSSTAQAEGLNSELKLKPVAVYRNPFTNNCNISYLVLCETLDKDGNPLESNSSSSHLPKN